MRLLSTTNILRVGNKTLLEAVEGVPPYTYAIEKPMAGGVVDGNTGLYAAPASLSDDSRNSSDIITATDAYGNKAKVKISILGIERILASIIARELNLSSDQIMIQNQKFTVPNDNRVYVSITIVDGKPFSNNSRVTGGPDGMKEVQTVNIREMVNINIMSSSIKALRDRHDLIMSLSGMYAQAKMERHSFSISKVPLSFVNVSNIEGATIPFGFNLSVALTYGITKIKDISYYDDFSDIDLRNNQ